MVIGEKEVWRLSWLLSPFSNKGKVKIVLLLFTHQSLTINEIARALGFHPRRVTEHLQTLQRKGLVKKERHRYSLSKTGLVVAEFFVKILETEE